MTSEEIRYEQNLIRRCQARDEASWFELFDRYGWSLWQTVRRLLGDEGRNGDLVEDVVGQVWESLGLDGSKQLRGYDPERSRFATFLARRAWQVVQKDREKRWRRRRCETPRDPQYLQDLEPVDPGVAAGASAWCLEEFLATLPEWEAAFCRQLMEPDAAGGPAAISDTCFRKRRQRLRQKLKAFLALATQAGQEPAAQPAGNS